jgi:probable H4MPT-linked C1 transfer pathway protein
MQHESLTGTVGWDIGGVNIKAARLGRDGWEIVQQPCAIWQERAELTAILTEIGARFGRMPQVAVTITAELSDAFRTKREGILFVIEAMQAALPDSTLNIFGIDGQFYTPAKACRNHMLVAAANWMATARMIAGHFPDCLLVDIGSTTTDIIPIKAGQVMAQGRNDPERLVRGELLYTGALRTPVYALAPAVPLWSQWCPVAAELFATTQDVHLLLGHLSPKQCTSPSADGRPVTLEFAAERLARIVCADIEMLTAAEIQMIAQYLAAKQVSQIAAALAQVISAGEVSGPVVAVGVGTFLAQLAALQVKKDCVYPESLLGEIAGNVAPAAAVALLLDAEKNFDQCNQPT